MVKKLLDVLTAFDNHESVLLLRKSEENREYHRPSIGHCRTSSHNVVSGAPYHRKETNSTTKLTHD
jgi:hypothetical protein